MDNYDYTKTYTYKMLLEKHNLYEHGVWVIFGEDPNCDVGGSHVQPMLGILKGRLDHVIRHAVTMKDFWTWGCGGDIKKVEVISV